ncbi:hypothetical protein [Enterococcus durans]|uniref:hypothetical protein n=1 Tax=Enterococcus durans TaxID=53345 RepID=UPI001D0ABA95|nr:hypothetical protein [Enterococcus durans]MCB8504593.1 hypothetical protein [Enterococcus durans]MCB8514371.1 hypothetical protein [Enterococcus durans]
MKLIEQLAKKARTIGMDAEILSSHELTIFPKSKKQQFYKEYRQLQEEHPKFPIEISYDHKHLAILSNEERKKKSEN